MTVGSSARPATPVEFDPYSEQFFNSPYATYRRLQDEAPVYYNAKYDFYALSRYEDVAPAMRDSETYSSAKGINLEMMQAARRGYPIPKFIITMDPPEHQRMRKLVSRVFTPRAIQSLKTLAHEKVHAALQAVDRTSFDAVADFSALFPVEIITTMLGVPSEDCPQVREWVDKALEREPGSQSMSKATLESITALFDYYLNLTKQRRAEPRNDMISRLVEAEVSDDEGALRPLDDLEIASFSLFLGGAGAETVAKLIGNAVVIFDDHPQEWQKLLADRSKVPAAVEELLRFEAPSHYDMRFSLREVTLHGVTIPEGSAMMLLNGAALRDSRAFTDADRFDIDRQRPFGYNLAFGYGIHSCLGAALARMESQIALEALLDFMPRYQVDRSGLRRVTMANVCGWSNVPVHALR